MTATVPTVQEAESLAATDAVLKRARGLLRRDKWARLGEDHRVLWGSARGSGKSNYDVRLRLEDRGPYCDCSAARRSKYCKHILALMLYRAQSAADFEQVVPDPVAAWIASKEESAERKRQRQARAVAKAAAQAERDAAGVPPSAEDVADEAKRAEARGKRRAQAEGRVNAGVAALDLWLRDIVRDGIAKLESRADGFFHAQSRALVDAQASGLARRVASLASIPGSTTDWPERMLDRLGRIALITDAYPRAEQLPSPLRADLRRAIGWKARSEEVLASSAPISDLWLVVGRFRDEDDDGLRRERVWLVGTTSGQRAVIQQYSRGPMGFEARFTLGHTVDADLVYHPSAAPMRAAIAARRGNEAAWTGALPGACHDVDAFLDEYAAALAKVPWTWVVPCQISGVVPCPTPDGWWLRDRKGRGLPLKAGAHWTLAALSGGAPTTVIGEWDGGGFLPLAAVIDGRIHDAFEATS
jgi:hypothetical protein